MNIRAGQLELHPLSADEVQRILRQQLLPGETWAAGYPSDVQMDYLRAYLVELGSRHSEHHWQAQLRRRIDGLVVGGAGVTGPPDDDGSVVIGYELSDEMRDADHGLDVVQALITVARGMGATKVVTDVFDHDQVRRHVYFAAGLNELRRDGHAVYLGRDI